MRRRDTYFVRTAACLAALALAVSGCAGTEGAESSAAAEEVMESQDVGEAAESQEAEGAAESSEAEGAAESRDAEGAASSPAGENGAEGGTQAQPAQGGYLHPVRSVNHMSSYAQDNRTLLCEGSSPVLSVRDAGYEALNEALALYSSQREAAVTEELSWMEEIAQEHLNTSPEGFYGYSTEVTAEPLRADAAVFSFRELSAGYTGGAHGALFALRALTAGVSLKTLGTCYALHPLFSLRPLFSLQTTVSFFSFITFRASWTCGPSITLRPYGPSIALGPNGTGVSLNPLGSDKTLITLGTHITSDPLRTLRPLNASHSARPGWTGAPRISFWPLRAL